VSLVFWENLPSYAGLQRLGEASTCLHYEPNYGAQLPWKFFLAINKRLDWYAGASPDVPGRPNAAGAANDLQSTATHEFGHATGWVPHYDDYKHPAVGADCNQLSPNRETMCLFQTPGTAWGRTLGPHDKHTFRWEYAPS
jgi:hypothetical protein